MHFGDFVCIANNCVCVFFLESFVVKGGNVSCVGKLLVRNFVLLSDARYMGCYFI